MKNIKENIKLITLMFCEYFTVLFIFNFIYSLSMGRALKVSLVNSTQVSAYIGFYLLAVSIWVLSVHGYFKK